MLEIATLVTSKWHLKKNMILPWIGKAQNIPESTSNGTTLQSIKPESITFDEGLHRGTAHQSGTHQTNQGPDLTLQTHYHCLWVQQAINRQNRYQSPLYAKGILQVQKCWWDTLLWSLCRKHIIGFHQCHRLPERSGYSGHRCTC